MDTETLTIVVLSINFGALIFVGVQTLLTRRALALAEKSFHESRQAKELSDLPQANLVLTVKAEINKWRGELQKIIDDKESIKARINTEDKTVGSEYGRGNPEGIINKWLYDNSPGWMQVLHVSAAQYYYHCKGVAFYLSLEFENPTSSLEVVVDTAREGVRRISEILAYIDGMVPDWYLECPASLSESRFFDKTH